MPSVIRSDLNSLIRNSLLQPDWGNFLCGCPCLRSCIQIQIRLFLPLPLPIALPISVPVSVPLSFLILILQININLPKILQHVGDHGLGGHSCINGPIILKKLGKIRQPPTMIQMKMSNNNNINNSINIILPTDILEIRIFLHVRILHMDTWIEYDCFVFYFADNARSAYLLSCA